MEQEQASLKSAMLGWLQIILLLSIIFVVLFVFYAAIVYVLAYVYLEYALDKNNATALNGAAYTVLTSAPLLKVIASSAFSAAFLHTMLGVALGWKHFKYIFLTPEP